HRMMKTDEVAVSVRHLKVVRGGRVVLPDLVVDVPRGAVVGLLGPSGCGKTTLMRSIVGVQQVAGGEVTVLGRPAGSARLRRSIWTLFHRLADDGVTLLVSSHVMDEASRCDRLLLMRDGRILADDTPQGVLASTGADDVEQAFLTLVDRAAAAERGEQVSA